MRAAEGVGPYRLLLFGDYVKMSIILASASPSRASGTYAEVQDAKKRFYCFKK